MIPDVWVKAHGASTHFPIAMALGAGMVDGAAVAFHRKPWGRSLYQVGKYMIGFAAGGGVAAVASGIALSKGEILGTGALRMHHLFAWPALVLLVMAAVWRWLSPAVGDELPRGFRAYLLFELAVVAMTLGAGYWGGELLSATT